MIPRILSHLFPRRALILNLHDFGPRLTWEQVRGLLQGQGKSEHFRLLMQILEFQRQLCQQAVQDKSNIPDNQTRFEAGGAAAIADVMGSLRNIESGADNDPALKQWFASPK